ncbi:hypothetical protein PYCCODRAFT_1464256 [Trametes coccinea BRFM310]|uniref:Uncharacterized protein n=1 Tax=Trametes coccinea (strain BRFM310) TaxID=1353009 RepID=A0A1Y2J1H8_TRAC3|nr:hypothetical protein PYCCODRAFT_1464256 [Trametes coccinea BRFM310]
MIGYDIATALEDGIHAAEVLDDQDAEINAVGGSEADEAVEGGERASILSPDATWTATLEGAATGVASDTSKSYHRLMGAFQSWLKAKELLSADSDAFAEDLQESTPDHIAMWILDT